MGNGGILPLMEAFCTLQGEGFYQGTPAYFIRLGGCDVGCHWCDVKESWNASDHPRIAVKDIVKKANEHSSRIAVVTGGEPAMYPLDLLTLELHENGFRTHIETSGAYPLTGTWDWICFSPKKFKEPGIAVYSVANELKVIIYHPSDLKWAVQHVSKLNKDCKLYLQPEWSKMNSTMPLIVDFVKQNPEWKISLQVHKFMNIP